MRAYLMKSDSFGCTYFLDQLAVELIMWSHNLITLQSLQLVPLDHASESSNHATAPWMVLPCILFFFFGSAASTLLCILITRGNWLLTPRDIKVTPRSMLNYLCMKTSSKVLMRSWIYPNLQLSLQNLYGAKMGFRHCFTMFLFEKNWKPNRQFLSTNPQPVVLESVPFWMSQDHHRRLEGANSATV